MTEKIFSRKIVMAIFTALAVTVLCFADIIPVGKTVEAAASDFTLEEALEWVNEKANTEWGWEGIQCVDLTKAYYNFLGYYDDISGNANEYVTNDDFVKDGWYKDDVPSPGAIIAWPENVDTDKGSNKRPTRKYGHVGIVVAVDGEYIHTVETNYEDRSYAYKVTDRIPINAVYIHPNFKTTEMENENTSWSIKVGLKALRINGN